MFRNMVSIPSWSSQDFDHNKDVHHMPMHGEMKNRAWDSCLNVPSGKDNDGLQSSGLSCPPHEADEVPSSANENHDSVQSGAQDAKSLLERKDATNAKSLLQQFAQRSRVRKLQYIAELEKESLWFTGRRVRSIS